MSELVKQLRLVSVYCDGGYSLVSLATGEVLADDVSGVMDGVPEYTLTEEDEKEAAGEDYVGDFPGWPAVVKYLSDKGVA